MLKLRPKQKMFVEEYLVDLNATLEAMSLPVDEVGDMVTVLPHALPLRGYVEQIKEEASRCGEFARWVVELEVGVESSATEGELLAWLEWSAVVEIEGRCAAGGQSS